MNPQPNVDIAVVGAGAAGLAAAIFAAETRPDRTVLLLDGARKIGAKILVSGGGRCNVTHAQVTPSDFHAPRKIVERVFKRFDAQDTIHWFESMDVPLKQEPTGKLFPVSNKARTVLHALLHRCTTLGIPIKSQHRVQELIPTDTGFLIFYENGQLTAHRVIMATGGRSLPKTGSNGQGWSIVRQLGHTVDTAYPALVPLMLEETFFHHGLSGISHEATVTTRVDGKIADRRSGSLLWTHFGVSGPVILDASRFWIRARGLGQTAAITLNFFPGQSFEAIDRWLSHTARSAGRKTLASALAQQLPHRVAKALCANKDLWGQIATTDKSVQGSTNEGLIEGGMGSLPLCRLSRVARRALAQTMTELPLPVIGHRGWNHAEVTAGGIPLHEVNPSTMASRKVPGLYLVGEMLDCDGRIGGFNFQWAWATGHIAGCSAAHDLSNELSKRWRR